MLFLQFQHLGIPGSCFFPNFFGGRFGRKDAAAVMALKDTEPLALMLDPPAQNLVNKCQKKAGLCFAPMDLTIRSFKEKQVQIKRWHSLKMSIFGTAFKRDVSDWGRAQACRNIRIIPFSVRLRVQGREALAWRKLFSKQPWLCSNWHLERRTGEDLEIHPQLKIGKRWNRILRLQIRSHVQFPLESWTSWRV